MDPKRLCRLYRGKRKAENAVTGAYKKIERWPEGPKAFRGQRINVYTLHRLRSPGRQGVAEA